MKENIYITICPTYKCNLKCQFCYLTNLSSDNLLNLNQLSNRLNEIAMIYNIVQIDVYGGQISILDEEYLKQLFSMCFKYVNRINITTNLTYIPQIFYDQNIIINVGWDYIYKKNNEIAIKNIYKLYQKTKKEINVIMSSKNLYKHKETILQILNNLPIYSFKYIPYIKTKQLQEQMDLYHYEQTIKYFITHPIKPICYNKLLLQNGIKQQSNHVFISPLNELQIITFNNCYEEFISLNNIRQLKSKNKQMFQCLCCQHNINCQSQHKNSLLKTNYDCIGLFKLIQWFNKQYKIMN